MKVESDLGDGIIWDRKLKRPSREERANELLQQEQKQIPDLLFIETIKRVSAFTGGLAAAAPTYHLLHRLIELAR